MIKKWQLSLSLGLICFLAIGCGKITTKSLLKSMVQSEYCPVWPANTYILTQASSYDRHSVSPDQPGWFANADASQYIRTEITNGRTERVMLDVDGPGAIVRFWLTTFKRAGKIRIYFDGKPEPEITVPAYDLMKLGLPLGKALLQPHSSYEAKEKGGSTLYLPLPYAKHCKVTFEDQEKDNQPRYYQISYRTYKGIAVETFSVKNFEKLKDLANAINDNLLSPDNTSMLPVTGFNKKILPNAQTTIDLPDGAAAVKLMSIRIKTDSPAEYEQALRSTILKIDFDGEQTVWCPVGDFSGSGAGGKPLQSWYRTVTPESEMISRWVMPYQTAARITVLNLNDKPVQVMLNVVTDKWTWNKLSMYFHADWKQELNVAVKQSENDKPTDWDLNSITGKGVFMGDVLAVYNHSHKWYGEGDQKLWVDGESFPSEFGTGTEDYYNTSWAPVVLYQTPFANAPRADNADSFGHNTFTRTRILDAMPFTRSLRYSLETIGWENNTSDFAATTYWYGLKGAKSSAAANQSLPTKLPSK